MLQSNPNWPDQRWVLDGGEPAKGQNGKRIAESSGRMIQENVKYRYKMRVETLESPKSRYRVKVWKANEPEPEGWDVEGIDGERDLSSGSVLLCSHFTDVTFGNLSVVPLDSVE